MANLKNKNEVAQTKTISLPSWMWDLLEADGSRSKSIREILMKDEEIKKGVPNAKSSS